VEEGKGESRRGWPTDGVEKNEKRTVAALCGKEEAERRKSGSQSR